MSDTNKYIKEEMDDSFRPNRRYSPSVIREKGLDELELSPVDELPENLCLFNRIPWEKPDASTGAIPKITKTRPELPKIEPNQLDSTRTWPVKSNGMEMEMELLKPDYCMVDMSRIHLVDQPVYPAHQSDHQIPIRIIGNSSGSNASLQVDARYQSNDNIHTAHVHPHTSLKNNDVESQDHVITMDEVDCIAPIQYAAIKKVQHADEIEHVIPKTEGSIVYSLEQSMDNTMDTELNQPSDKFIRRGFNVVYTCLVVVGILYTTFYVWFPALRSLFSRH